MNNIGVSYCNLAAKANPTAGLIEILALTLNFIMHCFASTAVCKVLTSNSAKPCLLYASYIPEDVYLSPNGRYICVRYSETGSSRDITIRCLITNKARLMLNIEFRAYNIKNRAIRDADHLEYFVASEKISSHFPELVINEGAHYLISEDEGKYANQPGYGILPSG